jgi:hypothetical protein
MRCAADLLNKQHRYSESYAIYDEVYRQILSIFSKAYSQSKTSWTNVLPTTTYSNPTSHSVYADPTANILFARQYGIGLSSALDEFISVTYGRLQSVCYSHLMCNKIGRDTIFSEFIIIYSLVIQPEKQRKIGPIFNAITITIDENNRLRKIRPNYSAYSAEKLLLNYVPKISGSNWKHLNRLLLDYLSKTGCTQSELYKTTLKHVAPFSYRYGDREFHSDWYGQYERSEYSKKYFNTGNRSNTGSKVFDFTYATEEEKLKYFGQLFGLRGKVTKNDIRSKYIQSVALYHPDKVQHLGPELKELAERKTKEFNTAYDWWKKKNSS